EARNFDIRKNILKFDNVMNDQRTVIFKQRVEWMQDDAVVGVIGDMRHTVIDDLVAKHVPENAYPEQWDTAGLKAELERVLGLDIPVDAWAKEEGIADEELIARIEKRADELVRPEDAHQVVFQRQEELRAAGVALAAGAAAQLIVDAPALVALGAEHEHPARGESRLLQ